MSDTKDQTQENSTDNVKESKYIIDPIEVADFQVGDTVVVRYKIIEGKKTRIQPFEGIVIAKRGEGMSKTFMVRKIGADGIGVERIFPLYSPNIEKIVVKKHGKVRRAKLYYLRGKVGRAATKIKERKVKTKTGSAGVKNDAKSVSGAKAKTVDTKAKSKQAK